MRFAIFMGIIFISGQSFSQSKKEVEQVLDQLKASGSFSATQIEAAKKRLNQMKTEEFDGIISHAKNSVNDPKVLEKINQLPKN